MKKKFILFSPWLLKSPVTLLSILGPVPSRQRTAKWRRSSEQLCGGPRLFEVLRV